MRTIMYQVTASATPGVEVGSLIVDTAHETSRRGTPRTWHRIDPTIGHFTSAFSGVALHRLCDTCRSLDVAREHGHRGAHGPDPRGPFVPVRIELTEDPR